MCNVSPKTSLLTSVKMLPSDHALCSTESRISAVGTVMFIRLLCSSASGFSRLVFLSHVNDLAAAKEKFSPGVFEQLSGVAFWALPVSEEQRRQCGIAYPASTCTPASAGYYFWRGCSCIHPNLTGISRGKKEYLFPLPAPVKRVISMGTENLQMLHIFVGFPHISKEVPRFLGFPSSSLIYNFNRKVTAYVICLLNVFLGDFENWYSWCFEGASDHD